ncbi:MAG: hypothetical protein MZV63_40595 [Marinilabiliales bacterium]|nr:hypothetical protein [Marinilabiliales bacterium]
MALLIKNIKSLINTETKPAKWVAGADMPKVKHHRKCIFVNGKEAKISEFWEDE